jgi:signal transduction histidine kinase
VQYLEANKAKAREARDRLVEDLLSLSRELKATETLERRLSEAHKGLEKMAAMEKELQKTQKELRVCAPQGSGS